MDTENFLPLHQSFSCGTLPSLPYDLETMIAYLRLSRSFRMFIRDQAALAAQGQANCLASYYMPRSDELTTLGLQAEPDGTLKCTEHAALVMTVANSF
jgi:hypothetical protein